MYLDLLDRTLKLPTTSKVVTQPYVDFLTHQYQLSHNGAHGIEHWLRVLINGRLIAAQSGADIEVVEHFALLHDVQRQDEHRDIQHGNRAADFAAACINILFIRPRHFRAVSGFACHIGLRQSAIIC